MIKWGLVLHFYQPPTQSLSLTEEILNTCYLPLCDLLLNSNAKITINLSASLLLQTQTIPGHNFASKIEQLFQSGKAEFLNSPVYHPIAPLTPPEVVKRQLLENKQLLKSLCKVEPIAGIFPPELAVDQKTLEIYKEFANLVLIDESSINPNFDLNNIPKDSIFYLRPSTTTLDLPSSTVKLIAASRSVSELIRSYPNDLHAEPLTKFIYPQFANSLNSLGILITMSDAEVFGHHYRERINLLKELFEQQQFNFITLSEAIEQCNNLPAGKAGVTIQQCNNVFPSSWQTSSTDLKNANPFPLWKTPGNTLQEKYHRLAQMAYSKLEKIDPATIESHVLHSAEHHFDQGISSCHTYWLSQIPWWHPDLVEKGAQHLIKCIRTIPNDQTFKRKAETFYHQFLMELWHHHWSGEVEKKYIDYDRQRPELLKGLPKI